MEREQALKLLKEHIKNRNLIKHCLAVEQAMRKLARLFGADEESWGLCGLLHDIDYEETKENPSEHSRAGSKMLEGLGFSQEICQAVLTHNEAHQIPPSSLMGKALYCVDPLTGLIVAATLVLPSRKIKDLTAQNVLNRFKEKSFAKGANREIIGSAETLLGIELEKFITITLEAMQEIAPELEL
jgi:hypothetical protein